MQGKSTHKLQDLFNSAPFVGNLNPLDINEVYDNKDYNYKEKNGPHSAYIIPPSKRLAKSVKNSYNLVAF